MSNGRRSPQGHDFYTDVWHRKENIKHLIGEHAAEQLTMINIDCAEYCDDCYQTLALIETKDKGEEYQHWGVTYKLALKLGIPGYRLQIELLKPVCRCDHCGTSNEQEDQMVRRMWVTTIEDAERDFGPDRDPAWTPPEISELEWATKLLQHHVDHLPYCKGRYT